VRGGLCGVGGGLVEAVEWTVEEALMDAVTEGLLRYHETRSRCGEPACWCRIH